LQEIIVTFFRDTHHLLDLRLGLEHEILGGTAAQDKHGRFVAGRLAFVNNGRGLINVPVDIEDQPRLAQGHRGDVHAD
jgi:hypothetical protein